MHFRKVICLGGLIALTGCCHTVPTNEFVDPRFNLTLLPYSKMTWMTTLRPTEIKQSNDKGTVLTKKCVLLENKIGFVKFECEWDYNKNKTEQLVYEIQDKNESDPYYKFYPDTFIRLKVYDKTKNNGWELSNNSAYYISKESMDLLRDKEAACALEK